MLELFASSIGKVLGIGLIVGAGLPALFALGIKSMAYGVGGDAEVDHAAGHPVGKILGYLCFAIVLAAIAAGIAIIVSSGFGYSVSFEHIVPTFAKKGGH